MENDKIKYEDLVSPDDSIKNLIKQLEELNSVYGSMVAAVKSSAKEIVAQLKAMSAATSEGRTEIDDATVATNRLVRAQKELKFAMSDTGREVAWLKSQTMSQNKMSVEMQLQAKALVGSYDKLKSEMKEQIALWKALSAEERAGFGKEILAKIQELKIRIANLDEQLKIHVASLSEVQKAEQRLAFLRSEEGKRLIELKRQIRELTSSTKEHKHATDGLSKAYERYRAASSATNVEIHELNQRTQEANRIAKLTARINTSAVGSYNQLSAQYELNKIKLNAMSHEERYATAAGKDLEEQTLNIYKQMVRMQEATGNHRLSVGNYKLAWNGLGNAMNQVIRELPAATMGVNTFFLAISNNIPVLIDEIDRVRQRNKLLRSEGKETVSVNKTIINSLLSWQTALILCLTALSMYGKEILAWITKAIKGRNVTISYTDAISNMNKELKSTNDSYGKNITTIKKLSDEWKKLSTEKEQLQWIKDNKTAFDQLDVSVNNVADAENIFVEHTDTMVSALKARAKAAAAMKLAADKYEEALIKEAEAEAEAAKGTNWLDTIVAAGAQAEYGRTGRVAPNFNDVAEANKERRVQGLRDEAKAAKNAADQYFNMAEAITKSANAELRAAGIEEAHKKDKDKDPRSPHQRDITDRIWKNDLEIRKKYEISLSELQRNEFQKRRIEAIDQTNQIIREMQEKFRKNEVFLTNPDNKLKPLTPEQRTQIEQQQKEISSIIENARKKLEITLTELQYEYELDRNKKLRQAMKFHINEVANALEEEKQLRIEQLEDLESSYSTSGSTVNGEVIITGNMTPEQIADMQRRRQQIIAEYDAIIYKMRERDINAQLELVKKGTEDEIALLIEQNEIARRLALAENAAKPVEERQSEEQINSLFAKRGRLSIGSAQMTSFDQSQSAAEAEFTAVRRTEQAITVFKLQQERERWQKQIQLARAGAIEWSDVQIKEAEAMIRKLEREIAEAKDFVGMIGDKGFGGALLTKLGFDDEQISALEDAVSIVIENIQAIADAEVEAAERAVEAAEKRVEAAQKAYDAEIEGRNNGYANKVATAKKELQQEQKNQQQKQRILEEAQRRQEAINSIVQASSLVTASANLWSSFSSIPIIGPALAIAAIASMWASFAVAKVRAAQITKSSSEEYGEGGLEFLEGGSHASGNDIDLHTKNKKGKHMRAEGGEAMAIINRRNTRRYRKILPEIVSSLNKGTFEEKFSRAFESGEMLSQQVSYNAPDLTRLEDDVRKLKENSEKKFYSLQDGSVVIVNNNVTKIIR